MQGIRKNGSQEAVWIACLRKIEKLANNEGFYVIFAYVCMVQATATARVRKMDKTAKKERFSIIFANICMVQAIFTKKIQ